MPISGMVTKDQSIIDNMISHPDIHHILLKLVHKKDRADMRLVCTKWATRDVNWQIKPKWQCMPNNLKKKYDTKRQQKNWHNMPVFTMLILFDCTYEEDSQSIQWIIDNLPVTSGGIQLNVESHKASLYPAMIAIQNKKPELARLLIESRYHPKNTCWKNSYDKTSVPPYIKQCLYTTDNRDFSFLLYLNAVWSDNAETLKKLYQQKSPTQTGQKFLITQSLEDNAIQCFTVLLKQKNTKKIIRENSIKLFQKAVITYRKEIPQKLLQKKLFYLNRAIGNEHKTILDYFYEQENAKAIALLLELGAKRYQNI
jgi:hypothetical protein